MHDIRDCIASDECGVCGLGKWAINLMLINVKFRRTCGLRRAMTGADLPKLDVMVVQINGIHIGEHPVLVMALGIDSKGICGHRTSRHAQCEGLEFALDGVYARLLRP